MCYRATFKVISNNSSRHVLQDQPKQKKTAIRITESIEAQTSLDFFHFSEHAMWLCIYELHRGWMALSTSHLKPARGTGTESSRWPTELQIEELDENSA